MTSSASPGPVGALDAQTYDHVYLSPHSDDAVLSCGGQIYQQAQQAQRPLVVTFFSGSPPDMAFSSFAQGQHDKWELDEEIAMSRRRAEDRAALDVLGVDAIYLDYLDCIYRLDPATRQPMYASEEGIFGELDPAESGLYLSLADGVVELVGPARASMAIYAPLTAGHHVDHQLMRRSAIELASRGYAVSFYEDYPYAQRAKELDAALSSWPEPSELVPRVVQITAQALEARIAAIAKYASQIQTLFGNVARMEERVRTYCAGLAGGSGYAERYWLPQR